MGTLFCVRFDLADANWPGQGSSGDGFKKNAAGYVLRTLAAILFRLCSAGHLICKDSG